MEVYVLLVSSSPKFTAHVVGVFSTHERAIAEVNRLWALAYDEPPTWNPEQYSINHPDGTVGDCVFAAIFTMEMNQIDNLADVIASFVREQRNG